MPDPAISVIMVDGGFRESFRALDYFSRQTLEPHRYELIWVEYTGQPAPQVERRGGVRTFCLGRQDEPQILGYAYNKGIAEARGDILVIPDGDVACEPDLLEQIEREHQQCQDLVLYVLRLDQPRDRSKEHWDLDHLKATCSLKHTYNFGGCTTVRRKWLLEMNGYEQLPFFAGYHYLDGDNYVRFKNMGLKIKWLPTHNVYHPWHTLPPPPKFSTTAQQQEFIARRAAGWDWVAYDGIDPAKNRRWNPDAPIPTEWPRIRTESGLLTRKGVFSLRLPRESFARRALSFFPRHGVAGGMRRLWQKLIEGWAE